MPGCPDIPADPGSAKKFSCEPGCEGMPGCPDIPFEPGSAKKFSCEEELTCEGAALPCEVKRLSCAAHHSILMPDCVIYQLSIANEGGHCIKLIQSIS